MKIVNDYDSCSECEKEDENAMYLELGEPVDYESRTAWLCRDCVRKIQKLKWPGEPKKG